MIPRTFFGPTTAESADTYLGEVRGAGRCLAFGPGGVDLTVSAGARWDDIAAQFPAGWQPDLVALWLNYTAVPDCLWSAPVPIVGLATDWNLLWHEYRQVLPFCDALLTDKPGVDALARVGIERARPAVLYGAAPDSLDGSNTLERDIDVLFVGNLHPAVQRERLPWLARLAKLADRRSVVIRTGISGDECRALMARSRVAFNRSVRSEANMRAFEAAAAGALLFQEAGNRELPGIFAEGRECVYYGDEDLEERLEHFLEREDERRSIAEAARAKVGSYTFSVLLMKALTELWETDREGLLERARRRGSEGGLRGGDGSLDNTTGADASLLSKTRPPEPSHQLFGAGLLTPPECLTAGLLPSGRARRTQLPFDTGPTTSVGDLRSGAPSGSGDPRRTREVSADADGDVALTLFGEGVACAQSSTPDNLGEGVADALSSPPNSFGEGVAGALSSIPDNLGEGVAGALSSPPNGFGNGVASALTTPPDPSFGHGDACALATPPDPPFGNGDASALTTPPDPPFARGGRGAGARPDPVSLSRLGLCSDGHSLPLMARVWMRLGDAGTGRDVRLEADLTVEAESGGSGAAAAWHGLGVLAGDPNAAVEAFRRAVAADPGSPVSGMALALALAVSGQRDAAIEKARWVLQSIEPAQDPIEPGAETDLTAWDLPTYPVRFDDLRVDWERAAWLHAGNPAGEVAAKRELVRWRLHALLADLTGELAHYEAAVAAFPDLPSGHAELGCALCRAGRLADALPHLRRAVADQPFDTSAARALFQLLRDLGLADEQTAFVRERRLLARAAPQVVPPEPWFAPSANGTPPRVAGISSEMAAVVLSMGRAEFAGRFGSPDVSRALCGYTRAADTHAVLTLLAHAQPRRVLEVGTALGHMTANLTEWTPDDAHVFSLGIVRGMVARGAAEQDNEAPSRAELGRLADHFGKAHKAYFIIADSMTYDFGRLAPLDFVFIDGGHDLEHALNDTRRAYEAIRPGGWLLWHDFNSPVPWVKVREAIERSGLPDPVIHVGGTEVAFLRKQAPLPAPRAQPAPRGRPVRVVWEGDQQGLHSLALVNRALCRELLNRGHDLGLLVGTEGNGVRTADRLPDDPRLSARFGRGPEGGPAQVHVRHRWPPKLEPPAQGRWVFMQPWEFGSLPKSWLPAFRRVDEVWAYSRSVRDCYLEAGVPADRVHVIPLGVDPGVFRPDAQPLPLPAGPGFRFLFVGGTIYRKGFDLLLKAYTRAFRPSDGVGLVIKDMGTKSFYQGQTAEKTVAEHRARGYPIEYHDRALNDQEMAGLYAACDCLAHPYRGEGFALPVVEAMACGLPAIVTGAGPALDYASETTAFLVPARRAELREKRVGDIETVGRPWMWEPDLDALVELLRTAASNPSATRAKGAAASTWIRDRFTWSHSADAIEARLRALTAK